MDAEDLDRARALLGRDPDWDRVLSMAAHHAVTPMLCRNICQHFSGFVADRILSELRAIFDHNLRRNLALFGELLRIVEVLRSEAVEAMPIKGPILATAIYGDLALREFCDLDIMVHPRDFPRAKKTLLKAGYHTPIELTTSQERAYLRTGYAHPFSTPDGRISVDVHWQFVPRFFSIDFRTDELWQRSSTMTLGPAAVRSLASDDLLLMLLVHGAKHGWRKLCYVCDIAEFLKSTTPDWARVLKEANRLGIERIVCLGVSLACQLLQAPVPMELAERLRNDGPNASLARRTCRNLAYAEAAPKESPLNYARAMARLRERWLDKARLFCRLAFTPGLGEWSLVRLPSWLFPLYRAVRFMRLLRHSVSMLPARSAFLQ
jgi:hypothetical protein